MKKLLILALCLLLSAALALPAFASTPEVVFTADSVFAVGKKVTVDIQTMTGMDARIHEAWLEGTVQYQWSGSGGVISGATGVSYVPTAGDKSLKVQVTCGDLVLTSSTRLVTSSMVVTTKYTMPPFDWTSAPTKATTKATTVKTSAPTTVPTTAPTAVPTTAPSQTPTQPVTVHHHATPSDAVGAPIPAPISAPVMPIAAQPGPESTVSTTEVKTTGQSADTQEAGSAEEPFPWWIVLALAAVTIVAVALAAFVTRRKK